MFHGMHKGKLCPFSFGLAVGITIALATFIMGGWAVYHHPMAGEVMQRFPHMMPITWGDVGWMTLWMLVKGFVFGFFVALFYDLFSCCRKNCNCGCATGPGGCACCFDKDKDKDKLKRRQGARDLNGKL